MKERLVSGHDDSVYEESSFRIMFILTLNQHSETLHTRATLPTPQLLFLSVELRVTTSSENVKSFRSVFACLPA